MKRIISLLLFTAALSPVFQAQADYRTIEFTPPKLGAPTERSGRGTRNPLKAPAIQTQNSVTNRIQLLAPKQTGLTGLAAPTLYWYASNTAPYEIEITVRLAENTPLFKKNIGSIKTSGIQAIRLSDYGVSLENGRNYTWSLALITSPTERSADLFASGSIRREISNTLPTNITQMTEGGYWYDAAARLVETNSPQLENFLQQEGISIGK